MSDYDLDVTVETALLEITPVDAFDAEIYIDNPVLIAVEAYNVQLEVASAIAVIDNTIYTRLDELERSPYVHTQSASSALWTVNHNLGFYPSVAVLSPGNVLVQATVSHITTNQFTVSFIDPQTGTAVAR